MSAVTYRHHTVDPEVLWEIINDDIPELERYCNMIMLYYPGKNIIFIKMLP